MKKKLLLSVLAAGLVLPTASALAQDVPFLGGKIAEDIRAELNKQDEEREKSELEAKKEEAENKKLIDNAVSKPAEVGNKGNGDVRVSSPDGKVVFTPAVDKTLAADKDAKKPEMDKKPVAPTTNKAANKAGAKKLPKTSAVK